MVQKDGAFRLTDLDSDGTADQLQTLGEYYTEATGSAAGVMAVGGVVCEYHYEWCLGTAEKVKPNRRFSNCVYSAL